MSYFTGIIYRNLIKPVLFLFPADKIHDLFLEQGRFLGRSNWVKGILKKMWSYKSPILEQNLAGLNFKNPIGLAAGFDYDADLVEILPSVGFGFNTVGTLTHEPYAGNPLPMLGRLPKSKSLLVNKGFKNESVNKVLAKVKPNHTGAPRGVSIGATNKPYPNFEAMVDDLMTGFKEADKFKTFDYYELNISCPNLLNIQNLEDRLDSITGLTKTLTRLSELGLSRPVFIKMPLERTFEDVKSIAETAAPFPVIKGLVFSNLAKDRSNPAFDSEEIKNAGVGNFSGKPLEDKSNELLAYAYQNYRERFILIGVGGVFTAEDAYKKIKAGASLAQLITGIIFMGPQQIGVINKGLARLLKKDGYTNISQAIGKAIL
ncbi:MAG: dihydroorotate dehydrogenase (quinone) [Candidatus Pacebacteria bacterium]|nr:dihydroorotate dehydrogenase (quinone) [Candidatus Paceibacterota bacterium]